jgi:hypothetical protein
VWPAVPPHGYQLLLDLPTALLVTVLSWVPIWHRGTECPFAQMQYVCKRTLALSEQAARAAIERQAQEQSHRPRPSCGRPPPGWLPRWLGAKQIVSTE